MDEEKLTAASQILLALCKAGAYLLLFLGSQSLISVAFVLVLTIWSIINGSLGNTAELMDRILEYTPHITLISAVLTIVILIAVFLIRKKKLFTEVCLVRTQPRLVAAAAAMTPALYVFVIVVMGFLPQSWLEDYAQASVGLNNTGVLAFLATVIATPVVEEVIFRGLIQSRLARALPGWLSVVISALLFGLCHGQAIWIAYATLLGLLFGWMALRSRSILPSLLAHFVFNAIGHFSVVLEGKVPAWAVLGGLLAISAVACLFAHRGLAQLFGREDTQPEVF